MHKSNICTREDVGGGAEGYSELQSEGGENRWSRERKPTQRSEEEPGGEFFNRGKERPRGEVGVPRQHRKPLTFVRKRINESINVAVGSAEC